MPLATGLQYTYSYCLVTKLARAIYRELESNRRSVQIGGVAKQQNFRRATSQHGSVFQPTEIVILEPIARLISFSASHSSNPLDKVTEPLVAMDKLRL